MRKITIEQTEQGMTTIAEELPFDLETVGFLDLAIDLIEQARAEVKAGMRTTDRADVTPLGMAPGTVSVPMDDE